MKKMYILALAALAMAFSCQKTENSPEPASEPVVRTFTCTFAQPDTKLAINDADGKTTWEVGDEILVNGEGSSNREIVTLKAGDISADGKTATITITSVTPYDRTSSGYISNYYASYPASACPTGNWYWNSRFNDTNHFLLFGCNDGDTFKFYNLCGIISFKVTGDFDSYIFSGNGDETVGYSALQSRVRVKTNHDVTIDYVRTGENDGYTTVPLTSITGTVVGNGSTINYICLPNGANFPDGFTIKFLKGGSIVKTLSTTSSVSVPRKSYRPLGDVTAYLKDYVAPTTHNNTIGVTVASATDLGSTATANCYIVSSAGDYKFKAVKGNSSTVVGTVASVDILWETWNNAETVTANSVIAAADYDLQSGGDPYVVFKTPATLHVGNALIAAKDAGDNILWSWHIWVPATVVTPLDGTELVGVSKIQDRNLGALVATSATGDADPRSIGLYYQWGRKDPFPGNAAFSGTTPISVIGSAMTKHNGLITTEYSIEHPTAYAYVAEQDNSDWNADHPTDLWIPASKSIYDPCPPGYRVPARDDTKPMFKLEDTGWDYSAANRFSYGDIVFPIAGYIDCWGASYANVGVRSHVWSATHRNETTAYCMYFRSDKTTKMYASNFIKAKAGSVRCVAE